MAKNQEENTGMALEEETQEKDSPQGNSEKEKESGEPFGEKLEESEEAEILVRAIRKRFWRLEELNLRGDYIEALARCGKGVDGGKAEAEARVLAKITNEGEEIKFNFKECVESLGAIYLRMMENITQLTDKELGVNFNSSPVGKSMVKEFGDLMTSSEEDKVSLKEATEMDPNLKTVLESVGWNIGTR